MSYQILLTNNEMLETLLPAPALKCGINFSCWFSLALLVCCCVSAAATWGHCWKSLLQAPGSDPRCSNALAAQTPPELQWAPTLGPPSGRTCALQLMGRATVCLGTGKVQMGSTGSPCRPWGQAVPWGRSTSEMERTRPLQPRARRRLHCHRFSERNLKAAPQLGPRSALCARLFQSLWAPSSWVWPLPHGGGVCSAPTYLPRRCDSTLSWVSQRRCNACPLSSFFLNLSLSRIIV